MIGQPLSANLWGKVIGLVPPMRLTDKSLQDRKGRAVEYAIRNIFSPVGLFSYH